MKINYRINLLIISMLVILTLLVAGSVNHLMKGALEEEMLDRELAIAGYVTEDLANPLLDNDVIRVQEIIDNTMMRDADIRYMYVVGFDGVVVAHTFPMGFPADLLTANPILPEESSTMEILSVDGESIQDIGVRVLDGMDAKVYFGFSRGPFLNSISKTTNAIVGVSAVVLLLSIVMSFVLTRTITGPMEQLVQGTKKVGAGNLNYRIDVAGTDEIGILADSFNQMIGNLEKSEAKYRSVVESVDDLICLIGRDLRFIACNRRSYDRFGLAPEDVVGKTVGEIVRDPDDKEFYQQINHEISRSGKIVTTERKLDYKGKKRWYSITTAPVFDAGGDVTAVAYVGRNITNYKRIEDEIRKLNVELEQRVKERTAELEEKYAELAHLNKLFVGRENRIIELKERISKLETEIESLKSKGSE